MASLQDRVMAPVRAARERVPALDHLFRTLDHYGKHDGSLYAAGVTFAAFLSVFPLLGLGFAVVGLVARFLPPGLDAEQALVDAVRSVMPGLITTDPDNDTALQLSTFQAAAPAILSVGLPLALWSGLGWLSSLRTALLAVFEETGSERPNWLFGKLRDLAALAVLGTVLILAVAVSGVASAAAPQLLGLVGLDEELKWLVRLLAPLLGIVANTVLFAAMFVLLARPPLPRRALVGGALLGALGFEVLKLASTYLLKSTAQQPAFQAFGIALILLIWINYFSRLVLYAASWAYTADGAVEEGAAMRAASGGDRSGEGPVHVAPAAVGTGVPQAWKRASSEPLRPAAAAGAGALGAAAVGALVWRLLGRPRD